MPFSEMSTEEHYLALATGDVSHVVTFGTSDRLTLIAITALIEVLESVGAALESEGSA